MLLRPGETDADAMRRRARDWARGAAEARELDRRSWLAMSPAERVQEGLDLIRIAEQLQTGPVRARSGST